MNNLYDKDIPLLALMTFVLFALKAIWVVAISSGPLIPDELLYKFNALAIFSFQKYPHPHYPPVYPAVLAPAFFFKHWYEGMLIINAFLSSLIVPATWFLARSASVRHPLIAALLASLLPMHIIYPDLLYSENLFVPLFVLATALALRGSKSSLIEALAFGFVLGIAHLTRYLFLPALPLLFGVWLYSVSSNEGKVVTENLFERYCRALLVLLAYGLVIGIWLFYGWASGFASTTLFGFGISGVQAKFASIDSFLMYAAAYSAYVILAWFMVLVLLSVWAVQINNKQWCIQLDPVHKRFLILASMLLGCYWAVAVQHSFGASYNYPVPMRIVGRYLLHLSPIMLVVGVWTLERITESKAPFRKMKAFIGAGALFGLALLSWCILFHKGIWGFTKWFEDPYMADVIALISFPVFLLQLFAAFVLLTMIFLRKKEIRILVLPIILLMLVFLAVDARKMQSYQDGLHYREFAQAAARLPDQAGTLRILCDNKGSLRTWSDEWLWVYARMKFWGVKQNNISIQHVPSALNSELAVSSSTVLLLTMTRLDIKPLRKYIVNGEQYYIYRVDGINPKVFL
ncbi:MAG: hypothetical protein CVU51_02665 [Deltaproteobacteria bacterium HGW-Deltaproteobacteria-1]|jgi:hypothetical protein|nr:MAG: hypothetical protein CVU51_02665 [Deltaproteobacteria bacterium HGW-Deltaproteobacteria-1]